MRIRTDLSGTLFLSDINNYAGGELVVEDAYSKQQIKLPGGSLVLYPSTSLHHVAEVTSGERLAAVFWLQSMVRSAFVERSQLFALDQAIQALAARHSMNDPVCLQLSNIIVHKPQFNEELCQCAWEPCGMASSAQHVAQPQIA